MPWTLILALALLALAATTGIYLRRAGRARREISARLHERALAFDRRCDVLQEQIRQLYEQIRQLYEHRRVDHLFVLVAQSQAEGLLTPEAARRLRQYALELRVELAAKLAAELAALA